MYERTIRTICQRASVTSTELTSRCPTESHNFTGPESSFLTRRLVRWWAWSV
jgi:hypothetical protein